MDSPKPPTPPDPTVVANAQGQANIDAARVGTQLNRVNQITPLGNLTYTQAPSSKQGFDEQAYLAANPDVAAAVTRGQFKSGLDHFQQTGQKEGRNGSFDLPSDQYTATTTLDPRVQAILDAQLATSQGLAGSTQSALGRVNDQMANPINYAGMPAAGDANSAFANLPGVRGYNVGPQVAYDDSQSPALKGLDFSSLGSMPTADEGARKRVEDAFYQRETSRLDPQFRQQEDSLRTQLMNRGMVEGSEGWRDQLDQFGRTKNDAYSGASLDAITHGGDEMARQFAMQLAARQQGVTEAMDQFGTGLQSHQQGQTDALQRFSTNLAGRQEQTQEQLNAFNTDLANRQNLGNEGVRQFDMQNTQHSQALAEEERKRALVMNELSALRTGSQVQMPQFASTPTGQSVNPSPIGQAMQNQFQGQIGNYNTQVGSNNSMLGGMAGLGGAAMTSGMFEGMGSAIMDFLPLLLAA